VSLRDEAFKSLLDRPVKLPPRYEPKVTVRITDDRTKAVVEFGVAVPRDGLAPEVLEKVMTSLLPIFRRLGYLEPSCLTPAKPPLEETSHAEDCQEQQGEHPE
jgi:hypothetical protein